MSKLFAHNQTEGGSIYISMKRVDNSKKPTPKPRKIKSKKGQQKQKQQQQQQPAADQPLEHMCLIRVHNNTKKISIVVAARDVHKFQQVFIVIFD